MKNGSRSEEVRGRTRAGDIKEESSTGGTNTPKSFILKSSSSSPEKSVNSVQSPKMGSEKMEETVGGGITVKLEPGKPPKLSRSSSQKIISRPAPLFDDYPDDTNEAKSTFQVIPECVYSNRSIGSTEHAMDCDCADEWEASTKVNLACGEDSDCINRATKIECFGDCGCGPDCQNQRFQRQQFASVTVIKTERKGYGLRADTDLHPNDFIFEYIGEVIGEGQFRRRMVQYDEEGIKHFYFMSLTKGEFVDATKKGNLGRFCNHSCNPNCYVDKWVVGDKLRMGIFAERKIKSGEELVFNYNVDRYGADPQPCYCDEPNCTGFIGGKTQTERATKLSNLTIEALGIDDGDGWDTAVAKKPRKKKVGEDDEEYVNNVQPKSLDEDGVTKVMATLMQSKEKWIAVKLLGRIQHCDDERVRNRVVKMHGYQILNSTLSLWKEDPNVVLQILDILRQFPRLTRNKISDSKIETTVESLKCCGDERVESQAEALLIEWSTLEVAYRIPRRKREMNSTGAPDKPDRLARRDSSHRERKGRSRSRSPSKSRSRSKSIDAPRGPAAPSGPRGNVPQRNASFFNAPRPPYRPRPYNALPPGWFSATSGGSTYYYNATGASTWTRPTIPAAQAQAPPPPPPKAVPENKALEDIINRITNNKANTPKATASASTTPQPTSVQLKKDHKGGKEKWRTYSEEKQKKLYENTLYPHIKHVVDKFKSKLPKEELKGYAKELSKKLVNSDFKNHRVEDPTRISSRQEKNVKKFAKDFFDKAVAKTIEHEKKRAEHKGEGGDIEASPTPEDKPTVMKEANETDGVKGMGMSDDDPERGKEDSTTPVTPTDQTITGEGLKRKRGNDNDSNGVGLDDDDEATPSKRPRSATPPPPPPPPPPPAEIASSGQATPSKLVTPADEMMTDHVETLEYGNLAQALNNTSPDEDQTPIKDLMVDVTHSPQPAASFDIAQSRESVVTDMSDNAPSPSLVNVSDVTPMESDSERDGERGRSFAGVNLERVQQLQVHDGA